MSTLQRALGITKDELTRETVEALVDSKTFEGSTLEFKRDLPNMGATESRDDFTRLVAALANHLGGVIVYGVKDSADAAAATKPIQLGKQPSELSKVLQASIAPRLPFIEWHTVPTSDGLGYLILEVAASPIAPHAVLSSGRSIEYWKRSGRDKYAMTEQEVESAYAARSSFIAETSTIATQLQEICKERSRRGCLYVGCVPHIRRSIPLSKLEDALRNSPVKCLGGHAVYGAETRLRHRRIEVARDFSRNVPGTNWGLLGARGECAFSLESDETKNEEKATLQTAGTLKSFNIYSAAIATLNGIVNLCRASDVIGRAHLFWGIAQTPVAAHWLDEGARVLHEDIDGALDVDLTSLEDPLTLMSTSRLVLEDIRSAFGLPAPKWILPDGRISRSHLPEYGVGPYLETWLRKRGAQFA